MRVPTSDFSVQDVELLPQREALQASPWNAIVNLVQSGLAVPGQVSGASGGLFHAGPTPLPALD